MSILIYTKNNCQFCDVAKQYLKAKGYVFEELNVEKADHPEKMRQMVMQLTNRKTFPQIIINQLAIGGFTDLVDLDKKGELSKLMGEK